MYLSLQISNMNLFLILIFKRDFQKHILIKMFLMDLNLNFMIIKQVEERLSKSIQIKQLNLFMLMFIQINYRLIHKIVPYKDQKQQFSFMWITLITMVYFILIQMVQNYSKEYLIIDLLGIFKEIIMIIFILQI